MLEIKLSTLDKMIKLIDDLRTLILGPENNEYTVRGYIEDIEDEIEDLAIRAKNILSEIKERDV
jgi:hypothetical protein